MTRTTKRDLQGLVDRLNRVTGNPEEPYTQSPDGGLVANIGNYHLSSAYGGYALHQMATIGGGVREPLYSGHVPARDLYGRIHAFLTGYSTCRAQEV